MNCYPRKLYSTEDCMLSSGSCLYHKIGKNPSIVFLEPIYAV